MIAFAHYSSEQDISGVITWLLGLMASLRRRGEEVCLNLHHLGSEPEKASLLASAREMGVLVSVRQRPGWTEDGVRDDIAFLNKHRPEVFLPQCLPAHFFAAGLAARGGLPCALVLHSDDPDYWALADGVELPAGVGVWVAVSRAIQAEMGVRVPQASCRLIPYGVAVPEGVVAWKPERFRVVYCGRMVERQKRVSLVLSTLIAFCQSCPWGEAVLIGDGPELPRLKARVEGAGLGGRIRFTGRLGPGQVGQELGDAQAILLMSDFEGLPVAMLEGMARGLVPVARDMRSGIPEIVRPDETGLLVSDEPVAAAEALVRLASDGGSWARLSARARAVVRESYSEEACFEDWWGVIEELRGQSQASYPLAMPSGRDLPPFDERLAAIDLRKPPIFTRGCLKARGVAGYAVRRVRKVLKG